MDSAQHAKAGKPWKQPPGAQVEPGGVLPPCRSKGFRRELHAQHAALLGAEGERKHTGEVGGGEERGLGAWEGTNCAHPAPPLFLGRLQVLQMLTELPVASLFLASIFHP